MIDKAKLFNYLLSKIDLPKGGVVKGPDDDLPRVALGKKMLGKDLKALIDSVVPGQKPKLIHGYPTGKEFLEHSGLGKFLSEEE